MLATRPAASPPRRCAWCHDALPGPTPACAGCGCALHPGCWGEAGRCPSLGCGPGSPPLPARRSAPIAGRRRPIDPRALVEGLEGALLLAWIPALTAAWSWPLAAMNVKLPWLTERVMELPTLAWWALALLALALPWQAQPRLSRRRARQVQAGQRVGVALTVSVVGLSLALPLLDICRCSCQ